MLGIEAAPMQEQAHADPAKDAQDPTDIAMVHPAAVFIGADIQTLMQPDFQSPVDALSFLPFLSRQPFGVTTGQQVLEVGLVSQALTQEHRALSGKGKASLGWIHGCRDSIDFPDGSE